LYKINRIHNWNLEHTSAWLNVFRKRIEGLVLFVPKNLDIENINDTQRKN